METPAKLPTRVILRWGVSAAEDMSLTAFVRQHSARRLGVERYIAVDEKVVGTETDSEALATRTPH